MNTREYPSVHDLREERAALWVDWEFLAHEDPGTSKVERYAYACANRGMRVAASMFASLSVEAGDRVDLYMCNRPEFVGCFLVLAAADAVVVPIGPAGTVAEYAFVVEEYGTRVLVSGFPGGSGCLEGIVVVCLDDGSYGTMKAGRAGAPPPRPGVRPGDLLEVMYASDTASRLKGMMSTHVDAMFSGKYVAWEPLLSEANGCLTAMSVTHVNPQLSTFMPVVYTGAAFVLVRRYSASRIWLQVHRHKATVVQAVTMIVKTLMAQPIASNGRGRSMKAVHYFLPLPKGAKGVLEKRYRMQLLNNCGSSGTLVGIVTDPPDGRSEWPSIDLADLGHDARITGGDGSVLPPSKCGRVQVHRQAGASLTARYWRDGETAQVAFTTDGWFRTGDYGCTDADDWLCSVDHMDDIVERAGENISTCEMEVTIPERPDVTDVVVLGISDSIRNEAAKAAVVPKPGRQLTAEDVQDLPSLRLSFFRTPSVVEFRDGLLRGEYGKILKNQLKIEKSTV